MSRGKRHFSWLVVMLVCLSVFAPMLAKADGCTPTLIGTDYHGSNVACSVNGTEITVYGGSLYTNCGSLGVCWRGIGVVSSDPTLNVGTGCYGVGSSGPFVYAGKIRTNGVGTGTKPISDNCADA